MGNNRWELDQPHVTTHFFISRTATLILTTKKTKHFLFKKNASKLRLLFQMLPKCFKIDSKRNSISKNASRKASKMWLHLQYASNKGQTITIKCFYSSLTNRA